ncbi:hypothetical protein BUALT_Bualt15G0050500 [Buddleja alternifolia]|uniref:Uncharacterized protein n=1 Tax=Buddleja alternifolia TaxID=168488 RepID=A0AAV6WJA1_9LAMI|nr:hypothetical protein BUALT_Bualt15G0050500 [Buddleja alternifolia]
MEGLIPFLLRTMKKQRPQNAYRSFSENSTGRSYHLLLAGDSAEGSSHRRTRSDFQTTSSAVDSGSGPEYLTRVKSYVAGSSPSTVNNGLMRRNGFNSAAENYRDSPRTYLSGR